MTAKLTLVARLRNSRLEKKPVREMSAGEQCLHWLEKYREARDDYYAAVNARPFGDGYEEAKEELEYTELKFKAARERMRAQGRFNRAMGEAA